MNYEEFTKNTHNHIKMHFENSDANNFSEEFLQKMYNNHKDIYQLLGGETIILKTSITKEREDVELDIKKYINSVCENPMLQIRVGAEIENFTNEIFMLKNRGYIDEDMRFAKEYQNIRVGQKLSKFLSKKIATIKDEGVKEVLNKSNSKINEILNSGSKNYYLRLSCSMKDYLKLGFQINASCTRLYSSYASYNDYSKAIFTYAQNSTIIATLYENRDDAVKRSNNACVRQVLYMKDNAILGMRKYGHSQEYNHLFSKELYSFLEKQGLCNDYKYLTNLKNNKIANYSNIFRDVIREYESYRFTSTSQIGFIDTLHYNKAEGDSIFYNLNYEDLELQKSIFDDEYDFETDSDRRLQYNQKEIIRNLYKSLIIDVSSDNLVVPYKTDLFEDYKTFNLDPRFFTCVNDMSVLKQEPVNLNLDI
ncbi:MAG: hypothetical protein ACK5K7_06750 [Bacilli bacterium]